MWVANNITEDGEKLRLQERVTVCFSELRELGLFSTDNSKTEASGDASNVKKGEKSHSPYNMSDFVSIHNIIFEMLKVQ